MNIAVIGANGQLGSDVVSAFSAAGDSVQALAHADIELAEFESVSGVLRKLRPEVIVNTAAMHHVDKCEADPAKAYAVNAHWRTESGASREWRGCAAHSRQHRLCV